MVLFSACNTRVLICAAAGATLIAIASAQPPTDQTAAGSAETGYVSVFNGENLDGWQLRRAQRKGYVVDKGLLVCPADSGGYLFTDRQYGDFVLRFEFRMTEGANSGVAIRTPLLDKKPAYEGIEIQILDNPRFAEKLRPTQYHGSVYDVVPAKLGALKPIGQWNEQEILCQGRRIAITVNGKSLVDVDLDSIEDPVVLKKHPGLQRNSGHIGLLGHGSRVEFRNLRIKDLTDDASLLREKRSDHE